MGGLLSHCDTSNTKFGPQTPSLIIVLTCQHSQLLWLVLNGLHLTRDWLHRPGDVKTLEPSECERSVLYRDPHHSDLQRRVTVWPSLALISLKEPELTSVSDSLPDRVERIFSSTLIRSYVTLHYRSLTDIPLPASWAWDPGERRQSSWAPARPGPRSEPAWLVRTLVPGIHTHVRGFTFYWTGRWIKTAKNMVTLW